MPLKIVRAWRPYFKKDHRRHRPDPSDQPKSNSTTEPTKPDELERPARLYERRLLTAGEYTAMKTKLIFGS